MRAAAAMALLALACGGRDDLDGRRTPVRGLPEQAPAWELPLGGQRVVWDLFDNRPSAAVHLEEALHIDATSPDFAKYAEGSYRSPWHRGDDGALIDGLAGELYFPVDSDAGGVYRNSEGAVRIAFYARAAAADQLVSVFLNEHRLRDVSMPGTRWSWYAVEAPATAIAEGENKLRFYFRHAGEVDGVRTAATFARFAIGGRRPVPGKTLTPPLRAGDVSLAAGSLPALSVDRAGRLSFYVRVPRGAPRLVLAPAGDGGAVAVAVDGAERWRGTAAADWSAVTVDLTPEAGQYTRIDLIAQGPVHWGRPVLAAPAVAAAPSPASPPALPEHVIVWTVSSLRADRIHDETTPAIARLAREGVYFRGLVAAAPQPGPSHVALLTGRYPTGGHVPEGASTLGERFRSAGFGTAIISGNGFVNDDAGYAQGFDEYLNPMRLRHPHRARILWRHAKRFISANAGARTFVYVATVEPHLPYTPSESALAAHWDGVAQRLEPSKTAEASAAIRAGTQRPTADERAWLTALYDAEVRDADQALRTVRAELAELGIADTTAIVVVGDHGEELFERGNIGHGDTLFQEALMTPLIVWFPAAVPARTVDATVDAVDVYATVLSLAGIGVNPEAQGATLLPGAADDGPAFSHLPGHGRAMIVGRYKLVVPRVGPHQLYDLVDDPRERTNLMGSLPNVERYLRNLFGVRVAYEAAWQRRRWGSAANLTRAFADDHGM